MFEQVGLAAGRPVTFVLPDGRYEFVVSSPRDSARNGSALLSEDVSREAGDGKAFVELSYSFDAVGGDSSMVMAPEDDRDPAFTLVVDDFPYRLDDTEARAWLLATESDPDEVRLEAEYDGRTISVDPYDPVAPADGDVFDGNPPRLHILPCPQQKPVLVAGGARFEGTECRVQASDPVPYRGGLGWTKPGKAWVVVRSHIDINTYFSHDVAGEYVSRETEYGEPVFRLAGRPPVRMTDSQGKEIFSRPSDMDVFDIRTLVFEVDEQLESARFRLALDYSGFPTDDEDRGAGEARFRFTRSFDLDLR